MKKHLIVFFTALTTSNVYADTEQEKLDAAINSAKAVCLVGDSVKINMDVSGKVTISKLLPGGQAKVLYENKKAPGAVMFENENIRQNVDKDIRECMKEQWPIILSTVNKTPTAQKYNVIIEANSQFIDNLEVGAIQANISTIDFYVDNEYIDNMRLTQSMPSLSLDLPAGEHFFRYEANIKPVNLRAVKASCTVPFEVNNKAIYRPSIKLVPVDNIGTRISNCRLTKD